MSLARSPSDNVNVGICWDADRLQLLRVGIEPDDRFLHDELLIGAGRNASDPHDRGGALERREERTPGIFVDVSRLGSRPGGGCSAA